MCIILYTQAVLCYCIVYYVCAFLYSSEDTQSVYGLLTVILSFILMRPNQTVGEGKGRGYNGGNLSIVDTIGTHITVPIIEVSLIHWGSFIHC